MYEELTDELCREIAKKDLNDTISGMQSPDFKERFKAEYMQGVIRFSKLVDMLVALDADQLSFTPKCPRDLLFEQAVLMQKYLCTLVKRAKIEDIELPYAKYFGEL